jgi:D-alanyl-D-alanine carboxypeptidase
MKASRAQAFLVGCIASGLVAAGLIASAAPAQAMSFILVEADSGKVLRAENATYPWYPASVTKLMTLYMTLTALRDHRITPDTLFTVSPNASAQAPTKMGFPTGTQVTVDNAIKMMMVKSANDMAVLLAEGVGGSIEDFSDQMTETAHRLGMTESSFVNPNGLPADGQITSARDLAMLARALIRDFPQYEFYWHIPAIKFGRRVVRNYNQLIGRYPGADGMKTGFICASGFNLVATATRDNKKLIAVVLGAPSSAVRAVKAAELLESGFTQNPLSWLSPALGSVDALVPMDAAPPNLKDTMCGPHRKRPAREDDEEAGGVGSGETGDNGAQFAVMLSALRAPSPKNANLLADAGPVTPVVVYAGPTRTPAEVATLASLPEAAEPAKKKGKKKPAAHATDTKAADAKPTDLKPAAKPAAKPAPTKPAATKPTDTKPKDGKSTDGKSTSNTGPWTLLSASALAASPPPELGTQKKPVAAQ